MTELFSEFEEASAVDASSVTLQELDNHIKELMELRELYDVEKKKASETNAKVEEKENFILDLLTALGRQSYEAEGVAKVTKCIQTSYKVPKEIDKKQALFNYIKGKYGGDALMGLVSINSATLNSWAKKEIETGDVSVIPGLELPTSNEYIQVRRK
jgi:hypothetical protein